MARPPYVALRLTNPRMGARPGPERELVELVQARLVGVERTRRYDCQTSAAVQRWQHQQGSPNVSGAIGPAELLVMFGQRPRPAEWLERARGRRTAGGAWLPPANPVMARCAERPEPVELRMIPRSAVGLRPPDGRSLVVYAAGTPIVVHWQGPGHGAVGLDACFAQLRGFQRFHMDTHGWSDIGYNLAIPRGVGPGVFIELRGLGVRGAHSGHNLANAYPGVLVMLGDDDAGPDADQLATLAALRGAIDHGRRTGHREWSATTCPGPDLWPWVLANR